MGEFASKGVAGAGLGTGFEKGIIKHKQDKIKTELSYLK